MSPSVTETVKFFLRVSAKSAYADFLPLKSEISKFHYNFLSVSKCYRDSKVFSEGLCKVCSWRHSSSEKSEISKFHYSFVECFLSASAKSIHWALLRDTRFQCFNTIH